MTRYNLTQASNPCLSTNDVTCTVGSPKFSFLAPSEVVGPPSAAQPALPNSGDLHTWNGLASVLLSTKGADAKNMFVWNENAACTVTFGGAGQNWTGNLATSFDDGKVLQDGSAAGDSQRQFAFKVAVSGCAQGTDLMMGWSGHIASHLDWGVGKGAGSISGAPFHMRILGVDNAQGTSGGNQDRSVQLSAIVQTLEVRKVLSPVGSGTFDLQIDNATKAAAVGNGGTTGPVAVTAGSHSVGELGAGGTNLASFSSSISCVDSSGNPVKSGSGTSLTGVNVPTGDSVVCTITNTLLQSHLTLVKLVTNDNGGTALATDWTLNANGPTPISGTSGSANVTNATVNAGSYALTETNGPSGYTPSAWVCVGGTQNGSDISLAPGQNATCTITNDDIAPKLHLRKVVTNDNGGTATVANFPLKADGADANDLTGTSPVDSGAGLKADTWTLSETELAGYSKSDWVCVGGSYNKTAAGVETIQVGLNGEATCTITNDDIAPKLHLRKVVTNDNGGTATVANFPLKADGTDANDLTGTSPVDSGAGLKADTWTLSETELAGYSKSDWVCVGGSYNKTAAGVETIQVGLNGEATCTITNDDIAPKLHLRKVVTNDNGGTATVANFPLKADGADANDLSGTSPVDSGAGLKADTWTLSETELAGYSTSDWVCVGGSYNKTAAGVETIKVGLNGEATCTITNDDIAPKLHLRKVVTNDNGGTATVANFPLKADGADANDLSGTSPVDSGAGLKADTWTLSETELAGYSESDWVCVGGTYNKTAAGVETITVGLAGEATCTITNDDIAPKLHLRKVVINDNGGTATVANFPLTADGAGANDLSGTSPVDSGAGLKADTWTLSETDARRLFEERLGLRWRLVQQDGRWRRDDPGRSQR